MPEQLPGIAGKLAAIGRERQLLERAGANCRDNASTRPMIFRRTRGSPPVSLSFLTPRRMKAVATRSISSRVRISFWEKGHVFRHAVTQRKSHRSVTEILR